MAARLAELAAAVGGELVGDGELAIDGLAELAEAGAHDLSFCAEARYRGAALASRAGALLTAQPLAGFAGAQILVARPRQAFALLLRRFARPRLARPGVHATALVAADAAVDPSAEIGAYVVVGARSRIGAGAILSPFVAVGEECEVGAGSLLHPHAVLYDRTRLGQGVIVHAGAVLGSDGFGYEEEGGLPAKVPHLGRVEIGDEVEIGANSAVDRGKTGATSIGAHTKIDNLVQVGHNVQIGRAAILCGQAGIAGSARLGDGVVLAGQSGVGGHLEVGSGAKVAAKSAVFAAVPAGAQVAGVPAVEAARWRRQQALAQRLGDLFRRLRRLERVHSSAPREDEAADE